MWPQDYVLLEPSHPAPEPFGCPRGTWMTIGISLSRCLYLILIPFGDPNLEMFPDESNLIGHQSWKTRYAVVNLQEVLGAEALSSCIFAPKAKIIALTWPLHLNEGKKVNIYTDSKYAFSVVNIHRVIGKDRLLTYKRKEIKHTKEVLKLLDTVLKPKEVAIYTLPKTSEIWLFCFEKEQHSWPSCLNSLQDKVPLVIALFI